MTVVLLCLYTLMCMGEFAARQAVIAGKTTHELATSGGQRVSTLYASGFGRAPLNARRPAAQCSTIRRRSTPFRTATDATKTRTDDSARAPQLAHSQLVPRKDSSSTATDRRQI